MHSPNRIEVSAQGPGRLVLSEIDYPGWRAYIDGKETNVVKTDNLLRSSDLPAGTHFVEFVYRPFPLYLGLIFLVTGIGFCLWQYLKDQN